MQTSKTLLVAAFVTLAAPHVANAGEIVQFSYMKSELATPDKRELLLDRIEQHSRQSCKTESAIATIAAVKRCANDLKDQFVRAIGDEELTLLTEAQGRATFRTTRR